jgi:AcrR family transcriptional regulator
MRTNEIMANMKDNQLLGLRERKKLKAKAAIQDQALRLFAKQGYGATTVEQIAEAAEVSPSTFFRYFKTKEAVVMYDSLDPVVIESFKQQPAELSVIQALRIAIRESFTSIPAERLALEMKRFELARTIPELKTTMLDEMTRNIDMLANMIAERTNHSADDLGVQNLAGSIIGVGMAALLQAYKRPKAVDSIQAFDAALARLEQGLSL